MHTIRRAVFLDRDGTLNIDRSYLVNPEELQLFPWAAHAVRLFQDAGFLCVVVTNQSAVGRGMMTDADLARIHEEMNRQFATEGVTLEGIYACTAVEDHPDRKPAPGMLLRAATDLRLDLSHSWMIGDSLRDILAGQRAGCLGSILVRTGHPIDETQFSLADPFTVCDDLLAAAQFIIAHELVRQTP